MIGCVRVVARGGIIVQETFQVADGEQLELTFVEESPAPRCGSCGAPIADGDLCSACEEAFSSVLGHAPEPAAPPAVEPVDASNADRFTPPVGLESLAQELVAVAPPLTAPSLRVSAPADAVKGAGDVKALGDGAATPLAHAPAAAHTPGRSRAAVLTVAAVVIVAVVGLPMGARWLKEQRHTQIVSIQTPEQTTAAAKKEAPAAHRVKTAGGPTEAVPVTADEPAPALAKTSARPAATAPVRAPRTVKAPAKPDRSTGASADPVPVASSALLTALAPVAPPPPPSPKPAAESQEVVAPQAPAGRLFESTEVDEAPRIATRVDPQLPGDLQVRGNDVVVVRILVSHTGHPFRINLLRRSRLGSPVDDAVVAAVKHWTFSPARKRGEAVSCWYNFGVTIRGN